MILLYAVGAGLIATSSGFIGFILGGGADALSRAIMWGALGFGSYLLAKEFKVIK